ncbi:hypothetical protein [Caballeronia sp. RCC_10]|uniref:hypothetical protein n=1 Tax=Caballeronia sp. RCC_10 TaxID=3239227 RepID=UPI003523D757
MHSILSTLSERAKRARERRFLREAKRAMSECACNASYDGEASRAERLRYIALFAQAGYFNGSSVEQFELLIE